MPTFSVACRDYPALAPQTLVTLRTLAEASLDVRDFVSAETRYREALSVAEAAVKARPAAPYSQWRLADSYTALGRYHAARGDDATAQPAERIAHWRQACDWQQKSLAVWDGWGRHAVSLAFLGGDNSGVAGNLVPAAQAKGNNLAAQDQSNDAFERAKTFQCSMGTVKGTYAFGLGGKVIGVGPIGASGTTTFDGNGNFSITGAVNTTTLLPTQEGTFTGAYTVSSDCTATATIDIPAPGLLGFTKLGFKGVIIDRGNEIRYLITTPGVVLAGNTARK